MRRPKITRVGEHLNIYTIGMKRVIIVCALVAGCFLTTSCRIYGLHDAYKWLGKYDQGDVSYLSQGEKKSNSPVLMLNGKALYERLEDNRYNVVYQFVPHCRGEACIPISALKRQVGEKGRVYLVTSYLTPQLVELGRNEQIYGMDRYYYGTKRPGKMYGRFYDELTSSTGTEMDTTNLYVFKGKQYIGTTTHDGLDELIKANPF